MLICRNAEGVHGQRKLGTPVEEHVKCFTAGTKCVLGSRDLKYLFMNYSGNIHIWHRSTFFVMRSVTQSPYSHYYIKSELYCH